MLGLLKYRFDSAKDTARRCLFGLRQVLGCAPRSNSESRFRLFRKEARMERFVGGECEFPFGTLRFVDGPSLAYQFDDIFLRRVYDFNADTPTPLIIDCGGNVGLSAIWFKHRYPACTIVVLEADSAVAQVLEGNLKALRLEGVDVINAAAWTANGSVKFVRDGADGGRIAPENDGPAVPAVRLADLITQSVDLLKLDIEGAEFDVVLDLCRTGAIQNVRRLICEIHQRSGNCTRLGEMLSALSELRFKVCIGQARCAAYLDGELQPSPFSQIPDAKSLLELYAWQS